MITEHPTLIQTLVCSDCHAGWYSTDAQGLNCSRCGVRGEVRDRHIEVALPPYHDLVSRARQGFPGEGRGGVVGVDSTT